jgi:glycosyltransferase involved in cell wall biosynthesis
MATPLVSVVCLCYNHAQFVREAINSVLDQSYKNIQIIVVDDASTDNSVSIIRDIVEGNPSVKFISHPQNLGNCAAFNSGLALVKGELVIDFATDDVMLPEKITQQVNFFNTLDPSYGVVFTDAMYINQQGEFLQNHFDNLMRKGLLKKIPVGDVYADVLSTYFIASPTMMTKKAVFDHLHGYDASLSYEDFDFWVRSSRNFKYAFLNEITTKIRISERSLSTGWYKQGDKQLHSTWLVCKKAMLLNRTEAEKIALVKRLKYEIRQSVFSENYKEAKLFYELLKEAGSAGLTYNLLMILNKLKLPLSFIRRLYHQLRYGG